MTVGKRLGIATSIDQPIKDGCTTFLEPTIESIRELIQISVHMFYRYRAMSTAKPGFQPSDDSVNMGGNLNSLWAPMERNLAHIETGS